MKDIVKVSNPLTIIAIFAGIAEVTGTTVLLGLPIEIQRIFVYFVMAFPLILVVSFFYVLKKDHRVLYAPSDFADQNHFIQILGEAQKQAKELVTEAIELSKTEGGENSKEQLENKLIEINETLNIPLSELPINDRLTFEDGPYKTRKYFVLNSLAERVLIENPNGLTVEELAKLTNNSVETTLKIIDQLQKKNRIIHSKYGKILLNKSQ